MSDPAPFVTGSMRSDRRDGALLTIMENITLARAFVAGMDGAAFLQDRRSIYAVTRCLEIISEATRRLGGEIEDRHPDVTWRQIAAAGNLYRHDYDNVAPEILWVTVRDALEPLRIAIEDEIRRAGLKPP